MLVMQILILTENRKYRKNVATKKSKISNKMRLKFRNPKFNIFAKITFFFYKMPTPWSLEANNGILEQVKLEVGLPLNASIF